MLPARYEVNFYDSGVHYADGVSLQTSTKGKRMASNPTPEDPDDLLALAEDIADGLDTHEVALGIKGITEADMRAGILAYNNARSAHGIAVSGVSTAQGVVDTADTAAQEFLATARKVLAHYLGNFWSAAWAATEFPNESTAVPRSQEERFALCMGLKNYFTSMPAHENAGWGVTAAAALARHTAISDARDARSIATGVEDTTAQTEADTLRELRLSVRGCIDEIGRKLGPNDSRWHEFGLSKPSDPDAPEPVGVVTLMPNMAGKVVVTWPRAPRATRYRVFKQVVGVDAEFVHAETVHDREAMLEGLPSGQTLNVQVVSANDAGEAQPSPTAQIVVP